MRLGSRMSLLIEEFSGRCEVSIVLLMGIMKAKLEE